MNAHSLAQAAYTRQDAQIRTPRATEYDVFARVTHNLRTAAAQGKPGFASLAEAVHKNRKLWTMLAADVADKDNALPKEVKARIIYLYEFTQAHSSKVLNKGASIAPLVEINAAMMRGLGMSERSK
ncbi:flagellar biosynthesis regulator FlaF [Rhodalgimonas zhirmunskyi]|uniref:Flagellar biosynthesis regulator FlaF n=1 Tax=Rhodalgimonas zhirmunskyi TaxID=2964767 RepID=A0AAJ1X6Z3_9RHOB|nr:flagellar biosynthesis regulator FlaF [Rhodoalgimonas zhirmunskyi]MDQ2093997.1 flagellar biosynthesis regulator FlaF [Rhodoalgimonas zhirmunskyi]